MLILPLLAFAPAFPPATARTIEPGRELYPAAALAAGVEGDVPVSLRVDPKGALSCIAHGPAALAPLKRASCQLIADRDVFLPRVAADGTLGENAFELVVRWRLKADESQFGGAVPIGRGHWVSQLDIPEAFRWNLRFTKVRVGFDVTENGHAENCVVEWTNGGTVLTAIPCPLVTQRAMFLPAITADGHARRTRGWYWTWWVPETFLENHTADAGRDGRTLP